MDIWGSTDMDIWAGGVEQAVATGKLNGYVEHSTDGGETWSRRSLDPAMISVVQAVWAAPGAGVYLAGGLSYDGPQRGVLLHSADNGLTWTPEPLPQTGASEITGIWGAGPRGIYVTGDHGTVLRWNGSSWAVLSSGTGEDLMGIFGTSLRDVWITGTHGTVLHGVR
jgi:photosystem II stability/assembly factor-like uncharacterized protein